MLVILFTAGIQARDTTGVPETVHTTSLEAGWEFPPQSARTRAYWWWLNGNVTRASITRDLEAMQARNWGGAVIFDGGGADANKNDQVKHGPDFLSAEWRDLYRHALHEARRLGLELSLNIQSGWNLGGPMVTARDAAKNLVWSELQVNGPVAFDAVLHMPELRDDYGKEVAVVAFRLREDLASDRPPMQSWREKALHDRLNRSAPKTAFLLEDVEGQRGEQDALVGEVLDLSQQLEAD
ncbi:MAG: glycosyl hydrolase, partial [Xanthomonadales bacterium]|nr:glycosyl hydrolase [Xanthomonadales bacterium]